LVATIGRAAQRAKQGHLTADDSDEDKPLSIMLDKTKSLFLDKNGEGPSFGGSLVADFDATLGQRGGDDEEDDDEPLGVRASRMIPSAHEDDDRPLAFHPEQVRRTQYMGMMAAQQQQQQAMMMQAQAAQMHQSMMFGAPSMMSSNFFGPPMAPMGPPMMMGPPVIAGSPPPLHDHAKYGMVDKWRQDVAVEGQPPS